MQPSAAGCGRRPAWASADAMRGAPVGSRGSGERQVEAQHRAAAAPVLRPDLAPVGLDDPTRDRQSESRASPLGGEERQEYALHFVVRNAAAGIGNRDL